MPSPYGTRGPRRVSLNGLLTQIRHLQTHFVFDIFEEVCRCIIADRILHLAANRRLCRQGREIEARYDGAVSRQKGEWIFIACAAVALTIEVPIEAAGRAARE